MRISAMVMVILLTSSVFGQAIPGPTHITGTGHAPVPRFANLPQYAASRLVVPAEQIVTLTPDSDVDAIEVSGTLKVSRDYDTRLRFVHLTVLPGGTLDMGTAADPVLRKVEFVVKDTPLLAGNDNAPGPDPEQFGNGILIFGQWTACGLELAKTWTTMQPTAAGATTITLTQPVNWQVGDSLLIPDTRLYYHIGSIIGLPSRPLRRESPITVAAVSGSTVTLSKSLDFEHAAIDGQLPYVANATRNIVVRSENPAGVRGHTMFMDTAHVNLYHAAFHGLGRTLPIKIDNTNLASTGHIGTNQIARYAIHWHHVHGHADAQGITGRIVGCSLDGSDIGKWGVVQHGTHDLLIADNVARGFVGAAYVTEDGYETRGQFLRNFAMDCKGNGDNGKNNIDNVNPGAEGSGFWFHGSQHTAVDNVVCTSAIGCAVVHRGQVMGRKGPSVPGGPNDTDIDPTLTQPINFTRFTFMNCGIGMEHWQTRAPWSTAGMRTINCQIGVMMGDGEGASLTLTDSRLFLESSAIPENTVDYLLSQTAGIHSSSAYTSSLRLTGVSLEGFGTGLIDSQYDVYERLTLKSWTTNIDRRQGGYDVFPLRASDLRFERMRPATQHMVSGKNGPGPLTDNMILANIGKTPPLWTHQDLKRVDGWNGDGKSYWIVEPSIAPANAIVLDGLVNAKAVPVDAPPPPPVNNHPVVSAITSMPADVDPVTPGVQQYELSTVTYSATANDPDSDALAWSWLYRYGGTEVPHSSGSGSIAPAVFSYPAGPRTYEWIIRAADSKGATAESRLTVQVIAAPTVPPATIISRVTLPNGDVYEGQIPRKP